MFIIIFVHIFFIIIIKQIKKSNYESHLEVGDIQCYTMINLTDQYLIPFFKIEE